MKQDFGHFKKGAAGRIGANPAAVVALAVAGIVGWAFL